MLYYSEAEHMFERIKENPELEITSVVIGNSIDRSFGRLYLRTTLHIESNFFLYHDDRYISYGIIHSRDYRERGRELIETTEAVAKEQIIDAAKLKVHIKKLFPDTAVVIYMSDFDVPREDRDRVYASNILLTGEIVYEDLLENNTDKTKEEVTWLKERYAEYNEQYNHMVNYFKEMKEKEREEERQRKKEMIKYYALLEEEEKLMKKGDQADKEMKKLRKKIKNLN